jgi:RsiW-degrading membrane proteinase PrsW (M82 family)
MVAPRHPMIPLLAVAFVVGSYVIGELFLNGLRAYPVGGVVAIVVFGLYAVPFAWFIRRRDLFEPEPPALLAIAFAWGALVATSGALSGNLAIAGLVAKWGGLTFAAEWTAAIAAPITEEVLKTLGVVAIAVLAKRAIGSTLDGMVYGAMVGLGFQVVENVVYSFNAIVLSGGDSQVTPVIQMLIVRGLLSGPWSHAMYSAIAGAGVGYAVSRRHAPMARRIAAALAAFGIAFGLHFLWNSPLLTESFGSGLGILVAILVKGLLGLSIFVAMYRVAKRTDRAWFVATLRPEVARGTLTDAELGALLSWKDRRAARSSAGRYRPVVEVLQRDYVSLAGALDAGEVAEVAALRARIAALRATLPVIR